jgi:putative lipoic acid-binding regulatory protein
MTNEADTTLLEFPCRFPIKAMGRHDTDMETIVRDIVCGHAKLWADEPISLKHSGAGNFVSVTAVIEATSKAQLDAIYQDLTDCDQVLMAL